MVAIYSWIILGVFGAQYLDIQHNASVIFFSLPWFQVTYNMLNLCILTPNTIDCENHPDLGLDEGG